MIGLQSVPIQQLMSFSSDPNKKVGSNFIRKDEKKESPAPVSPSVYISESPSAVSDSTNAPDSMFPYQSPLSQ
jgi:hypothetical protein